MPPMRLTSDRAQLLVVDIQERLIPHISGHAELIQQSVRMLRAAALLSVAVTISEQYPQGLGPTHGEIRAAAGEAALLQKMSFSVCGEEHCLSRVRELDRPQVLLLGIETHVCVLQTALDLLAAGLSPVLLCDAVGSRRVQDREVALGRMRDAGVLLTTVESVIYELMGRAGTDVFRRMLPIVR